MSSNTTESVHLKFTIKYDALRDIITYFEYVLTKFNNAATARASSVRSEICNGLREHIHDISLQIESNFVDYQDRSMPSLLEHYKIVNEDHGDVRSIFNVYQKNICSSNILGKIDQIFRSLQDTKEKLSSSRGFKTFLKTNHNLNSDLRKGASHQDAGPTAEEDEIVNDIKTFMIDSHNAALDSGKHTESVFTVVRENIMSRLDFEESCNRLFSAFSEQKIVFTREKQNPNKCDCGGKMTLYYESAELRCNECGRVIILQGTASDDVKVDSQNLISSKSKRYDPKRHCEKRFMQIQAKEDWKVPDNAIARLDKRAVREYRYGGGLRKMDGMSCEQIRRWLKEENLTKHNHHAPLIRKHVTGLHGDPVMPPQLTPEESHEVLMDFSTAMFCYEQITNTEEYQSRYEKDRNRARVRNKPNRFYYWFVLYKILSKKFKGDSRLPKILECIHLQSGTTINKNNDIWDMMCKHPEMHKYRAE
jgi:hypothetical protein